MMFMLTFPLPGSQTELSNKFSHPVLIGRIQIYDRLKSGACIHEEVCELKFVTRFIYKYQSAIYVKRSKDKPP